MNLSDFRPTTFIDVSGQDSAKNALRFKSAAFLRRGIAPGHMLFLGPSGTGKTTLARVFANEMGVGFHELLATRVGNFASLIDSLKRVKANDIVFIDEIHKLSDGIQTDLYPIMEEFRYSSGAGDKQQWETLPRFTLIGATTHEDALNDAFMNRFGPPIHLRAYTELELSELIRGTAKRVYNVDIVKEAVEEMDVAKFLARLSHGTPRVAFNFLTALMEAQAYYYGTEPRSEQIKYNLAVRTLQTLRVDPLLGLDSVSRQYLATLDMNGPLFLRRIAGKINKREEALSEKVEPYLIRDDLCLRVYDPTLTKAPEIHTGALVAIDRKRELTASGKLYMEQCRMLQAHGWFEGERL